MLDSDELPLIEILEYLSINSFFSWISNKVVSLDEFVLFFNLKVTLFISFFSKYSFEILGIIFSIKSIIREEVNLDISSGK